MVTLGGRAGGIGTVTGIWIVLGAGDGGTGTATGGTITLGPAPAVVVVGGRIGTEGGAGMGSSASSPSGGNIIPLNASRLGTRASGGGGLSGRGALSGREGSKRKDRVGVYGVV